MNTTIENRKAYYDYFILETLECGISLKGHEVKSIRKGSCNLKDAYCVIEDGELILLNSHISNSVQRPFGTLNADTAMDFDIAEKRERKLLAHKQEIRAFQRKLMVSPVPTGLGPLRRGSHRRRNGDQGITLIPLKMYFVDGRVKVLVGLCKGKHNYDKRNVLKEKTIKREMERDA